MGIEKEAVRQTPRGIDARVRRAWLRTTEDSGAREQEPVSQERDVLRAVPAAQEFARRLSQEGVEFCSRPTRVGPAGHQNRRSGWCTNIGPYNNRRLDENVKVLTQRVRDDAPRKRLDRGRIHQHPNVAVRKTQSSKRRHVVDLREPTSSRRPRRFNEDS